MANRIHGYSPAYYHRVIEPQTRIKAEHPTWTDVEVKRFARGHGAPGEGITPEHGGAGRRRPEPGAPQAHRRVQAGPGRTVETTYRDREVIREVNKAARDGESSGNMPRVQINTHTRAEGWQRIGQTSRGYSASELADRIARHGGNLREAIADLVADSAGGDSSDFDIDGYAGADGYADAVDDWQIVVND